MQSIIMQYERQWQQELYELGRKMEQQTYQTC